MISIAIAIWGIVNFLIEVMVNLGLVILIPVAVKVLIEDLKKK